MANKEVILSDKEQHFVDLVIEHEGNISKAAQEAGYAVNYGYVLRKKLAKYIAEAAQEYIAMHSAKAAKKLVDMMDEELPNPVRLSVVNANLDRAGVKAPVEKDNEGITVKANIFILPEKRQIEIDATDII